MLYRPVYPVLANLRSRTALRLLPKDNGRRGLCRGPARRETELQTDLAGWRTFAAWFSCLTPGNTERCPILRGFAKGWGSLSVYAARKKTQKGKGGPTRQRRFYDFVVWSERKRTQKLLYMHHNPVKRGLVLEPGQWRWSSFRHYAYGERGSVLVNEQRPRGEMKIRVA